MISESGVMDGVDMVSLALFLCTCGLSAPRAAYLSNVGLVSAEPWGVRTIQLDVCEGAAEGKSKKGGDTLLEIFRKKLSSKDIHGIKVTASKVKVNNCPSPNLIKVRAKYFADRATEAKKSEWMKNKNVDGKTPAENLVECFEKFVAKERKNKHGKEFQTIVTRFDSIRTNRDAPLDDVCALYHELFRFEQEYTNRTTYAGGVPGQWGWINPDTGKWQKVHKDDQKVSVTT
jgi:hypothetical protein